MPRAGQERDFKSASIGKRAVTERLVAMVDYYARGHEERYFCGPSQPVLGLGNHAQYNGGLPDNNLDRQRGLTCSSTYTIPLMSAKREHRLVQSN
jgi:hypothetical protein